MCTPSIIFVTLSTPRTHENVELGAAKHGAVHIPTKLWCNKYPHQTFPYPWGYVYHTLGNTDLGKRSKFLHKKTGKLGIMVFLS